MQLAVQSTLLAFYNMNMSIYRLQQIILFVMELK